jgi:hypothetical protein
MKYTFIMSDYSDAVLGHSKEVSKVLQNMISLARLSH